MTNFIIMLIDALVEKYHNRKHGCKDGLHAWVHTSNPSKCVCGAFEWNDRHGEGARQ